MHINVDSIFEGERQTDAVVMEILLILEVITAKKRQTFTVGVTGRWMQNQPKQRTARARCVPDVRHQSGNFSFGDIFLVKLQTYAAGNIPFVVPWVQK